MKCSKCGKEKSIDEFRSIKDPNKYVMLCLSCRDKKKKRDAKYYQENKNQANQKKSEYYQENRQDILDERKEYYTKNKVLIKKNVKDYQKARRKIDPVFKLRQNISSTIFQMLRVSNGSKFGRSVLEYLPYTIQELKRHIEKQFEPWMNWDNQGIHKSSEYDENNSLTWTWHIDHIIPQAGLSYSSMEEPNFQKCWALNNLRPLKSIENIRKGNR